MRLEMELDYEKNCTVGLSPNTVLPTHQNCSYNGNGVTKGRISRKDELLILKDDFREINFSRYRSVSCKSNASRPVTKECSVEFKRGSIYQSSKEVRKMKKMGTMEGRKKIEVSRNSDLSLSVVDSLCSSDEETSKRRSPAIAFGSSSVMTSVSKPYVEPHKSNSFFEICLDPGSRGNNSAECVGAAASVDSKMRSEPVVGPLSSSNELPERDAFRTLHKSVSAKVELPPSPSQSESDCSSKTSSKVRFSPIRKMFDPFMKSKSLRSPLSYVVEPGEIRTNGLTNMRTNKTNRKSHVQNFSDRAQDLDCESQIKSKNQSFISCSPVHLHAYLKLENKHGLPVFEFSLKSPEDVLVAKTWKAKDAFNWVYTFHSSDGGKKSNASRLGLLDNDKDSSMVGQMQVSCYLCSELKEGVFDNSMVTEFVLYDIAHARLSDTATKCTLDSDKVSRGSDEGLVGETLELENKTRGDEVKVQQKHVSDDEFNHSNSCPWKSASLHPSLEIAAIVMHAPFEKRESLKYKRGDKNNERTHKNLLNLSMAEQRKQDFSDGRTPDKVKVVIPAGNHGLPSTESGSPSSLLNRWRLGGGCDCGGWDMACPLTVLGNPHFHCANNSQSLVENQMPMELYVQGVKDSRPALTMTVIEEGLYAVGFHAQLSSLQAFSICVSILHGTETSVDTTQDRNKELSRGTSLKLLIEEEVKFLIEAVTAEKRNVTKRVKEIPPSYVLNPPFSPISRV
ncbi:hypothetical protein F8388_026299 [Cannabis sativa]|uniref:Uncharacterized protein n=1 Tax=Cannabis sativa TaxID=3483 RepID=A0A7J6E4R5_CANSA|nr:hypothetical protein F8388_026299 [Cannabis sativa]